MSSVDTNVLLRYLISEDDPAQHLIAKKFIEQEKTKPKYVSVVVMVELVWLLERSFNIERTVCEMVLTQLLACHFFRFDAVVRKALPLYIKGYDFADAVIGIDAKEHHSQPVMTFDKKSAKMTLFTLIS